MFILSGVCVRVHSLFIIYMTDPHPPEIEMNCCFDKTERER